MVAETRSVIELKLSDLSQLFNSLDPSPFHERDLDDDAEAFIVSWAREFPAKNELKIVVHLPAAQALAAEEKGMGQTFAHYFGERAAMAQRELREELRLGRRYLWVGLPVLAVCLGLSQVASHLIATPALARVLEESFIILGWVASWKAIETLLYDWQPLARRRNLYRRLARAEVVVDGH